MTDWDQLLKKLEGDFLELEDKMDFAPVWMDYENEFGESAVPIFYETSTS